jgi:hypothetical protein
MTADAKKDIKVFRAALFPLAVAIAGPALVIIFGMMLRLEGWRRLDWKTLSLGAASIALAGMVFAWVISFWFPIKLSPTGIHGHSFWGVPRFIAWPDITRATRFRYLSFKFLRLHPPVGAATWIALSQGRQKQFEDEIRRLSPSDCPIRAYLTTRDATGQN